MMMGVIAVITSAIQANNAHSYSIALKIVCVMVLVVSGNSYLSGRLRISYPISVMQDFKHHVFLSILYLPFEKYLSVSKDIHMSHMINDMNTFEGHFFSSINRLSYWGVFILIGTVILACIDPYLTIFVIPVELLICVLSIKLTKKIERLEIDLSTYQEKYTVASSNLLSGIELLKFAGLEASFADSNMEKALQLERLKSKYRLYKGMISHFLSGTSMVLSLSIIIYLFNKVLSGEPVAYVLIAYQISSTLCYAVSYCVEAWNGIRGAKAISEFISKDADLQLPAQSHDSKVIGYIGDITAENLSFSYKNQPIFTSVSLHIEARRKYLIIGHSGSGKTTLLNLLSHMIEDYGGRICANGIDYRAIFNSAFFQKSAIIQQETFIFEDTLRNNITLFDQSINDEVILSALEQCGLDDWFSHLPLGLDEPLRFDGKNISGGQLQRIAIVRSLLKKPDILFADEITASLDDSTAIKVEEMLLSLPCTVVSVSHRIHSTLCSMYDYVIDIQNKSVCVIPAKEYFCEEKEHE